MHAVALAADIVFNSVQRSRCMQMPFEPKDVVWQITDESANQLRVIFSRHTSAHRRSDECRFRVSYLSANDPPPPLSAASAACGIKWGKRQLLSYGVATLSLLSSISGLWIKWRKEGLLDGSDTAKEIIVSNFNFRDYLIHFHLTIR